MAEEFPPHALCFLHLIEYVQRFPTNNSWRIMPSYHNLPYLTDSRRNRKLYSPVTRAAWIKRTDRRKMRANFFPSSNVHNLSQSKLMDQHAKPYDICRYADYCLQKFAATASAVLELDRHMNRQICIEA